MLWVHFEPEKNALSQASLDQTKMCPYCGVEMHSTIYLDHMEVWLTVNMTLRSSSRSPLESFDP